MTLKQLIENVGVEDLDRNIIVTEDIVVVSGKPTELKPVKRINAYDPDKEFFDERY